ncbi:cysteine desulfurase-like protein [Paracoccus liaowanqingii]|uniref:Cysteine desulfurase-like protein n=1 Tax=Paracoccus liaowanqingii TaxID=2560053 RepID=A0A4Z1CSC8_9RHOB|nr:cysteine desulfurase-like protein [Paracoccus liaowanqingii]TGN68182.1 cysteine desulfurase-like protein [Paracoccus liaowanqingii]
MSMIDKAYVDRQFPSLNGDTVFLDNAGGSQVAVPVVDRVSQYLLGQNVQLGASYGASQRAGGAVAEGRAALALLMNASRPEEVVMGATATQLFDQLARSLVQKWQPGDEVIVTSFDHEANIAPWRRLEAQGIVIREWHMPEGADVPSINDLQNLMTERTRLVAVTHVSNVFGSIMPIREIADAVHDAGAMICVDGVAYAPHRAVDVQALDADFYGFSVYKVYGPHHAALYGRYDLLRDHASNINHYFYGEDKVPNKLEPGNPNYELAYGCVGVIDYLEGFAQAHGAAKTGREAIEAAFAIFSDHEEVLSRRLLDYLQTRNDVTIIGTRSADKADRVPTISFIVDGQSSDALVRQIDPSGIGIRFGDFHSKRLVNSLGLNSGDGVIRVSAVHYNTVAEIDRLIEQLEILRRQES